ncbi:L-alanine-DL-glutamate epimerase [Bacteroides pyogenes JCM 6292]|uniref:L-alanine-DL-glutamate epimerase n=1 Tax=Bacteroides pyogenes JCM 6292 TaxID=1235809 RepID=W4P7A4_9BACE|nr:L-alanine-DL-glutamate epimerase [Bacteroides pyogenes JCM 6292]
MKTAALAVAGSGMMIDDALRAASVPAGFSINRTGLKGKMQLSFFPYELKLKHVFTVAAHSRTTTPDVQVEIRYEGITGYGEASLPPYLGQTVETVMAFLKKVNLDQFEDPSGWKKYWRMSIAFLPETPLPRRLSISPFMIWRESCWELLGIRYGG